MQAECRKGWPLRILIASPAPLHLELGVSQTAMGFHDALGRLGHEVLLWCPSRFEAGRLGWNGAALHRLALENYLARCAPVDVVDLPGELLSQAIAANVPVTIVRSVQPQKLYIEAERRALERRSLRGQICATIHFAARALTEGLAQAGRRRAKLLLCLGSLESNWMRVRCPELAARVRTYYTAPPDRERCVLGRVAAGREARQSDSVDWLWIGRWAAHKGIDTLQGFIRRRLRTCADRFTVAGCGADGAAALREEFPGEARLRVVPTYRRSELGALLAGCDAGLFTSSVEGWGLSVQEMLESSMPVFATEAGCVPDLAPLVESGLERFPPADGSETLPVVRLRSEYWSRMDWAQFGLDYEELCLEVMGRCKGA